jgi:hypothetical protein
MKKKIVELRGKETPAAPEVKEEKISLSLRLPLDLYNRVKMEALMGRCTIGSLIEKWAERHASATDVVLTADALAQAPQTASRDEQGEMVPLSSPVSRKYHGLIRLEALRQGVPVRTLVSRWIAENTRAWVVGTEGEEPAALPVAV